MYVFWDEVWKEKEIDSYVRYIDLQQCYTFINIFKEHKVNSVCDIGCGFGKYSAICASNDFIVSGIDISQNAVRLSSEMLKKHNLAYGEFKVCSVTDIAFKAESFEGVIAHAVIDHLKWADAVQALNEIFRILKKGGLAYISFDGIDEGDITANHDVLEDGTFQYDGEDRAGMLFRFYTDKDIETFLVGKEILYQNTKPNGEREVILRKTI